jgi:putative ABC transport system permease protein
MSHLVSDLRQAFRSLVRGGSSTAAAFLTLALGLGLTTALFAVVDGVLLRPLPYPNSEQLLLVSEHRPGASGGIGGILSNGTAEAWRGAKTIEGPAAYSHRAYVWSTPQGADRLAGGQLSPAAFGVLRVQPHRGRFFDASEEQTGRDAVVVLSYGLWMSRFGGRDDAIGERMRLDDRDYQVVGIAPPGFAFPSADARLWTPATRLVPDPAKPQVRIFPAIARLRPGFTLAQATAEGTAAARGVTRGVIDDLFFGKGRPLEVRLLSMLDETVATVKPALYAVAGGVVLLLLVACANVANLLLAAGVARRRELAVRAAIGASRRQLLRLMLVEHALLAAAGLAAGWMIAVLVVDALPIVAPADFPRLDGVAVTARVIAASGGVALLTVIVAGLLPAWRGSRAHLALAMKDDDGRSAGETSARLRTTLLVAEAALALVLVVGALLLARSVDHLRRVDAGYDPTNVLTARLDAAGAAKDDVSQAALVDGVLRRVRALPGVTSAGAANMAPFGSSISMATLELPGRSGDAARAEADHHLVTPALADALSLRVV